MGFERLFSKFGDSVYLVSLQDFKSIIQPYVDIAKIAFGCEGVGQTGKKNETTINGFSLLSDVKLDIIEYVD